MVLRVSETVSRLVIRSDTGVCKQLCDEVSTAHFSTATLEQRLKKNWEPATSFLDYSFDAVFVPTQSHTISHTSVDDSKENVFDTNDRIIKSEKLTDAE